MVIGARYNEGVVFRFGAVDIYEIGFYPRELTPAERDALETYVQHRHGLAWNPRFIGADLAWLHDVGCQRLRPDRRCGRSMERPEQERQALGPERRGPTAQDLRRGGT